MPSVIENLFAHPYIMLFVALFGMLMLLVPVVILWQLKMLTGVVFAIIILAIAYALTTMKFIDLQKYPRLGLVIIGLALGGFLVGYMGERSGAFFVTPLMEKETIVTPFLAETPETLATGNVEVILLFVLMLVLVFGWYKRAK